MKSHLLRCIRVVGIVSVLVVFLLGLVIWWQWPGVASLVAEYREGRLDQAMVALVRDLPEVDEVTVLRLSHQALLPSDPVIGEAYHGGMLHGVRTAKLSGAEAAAFAALWRRQPVGRNGVNCHEPHHAVMFFQRGREVARAILCFECANAAIPNGIFGNGLMGFHPFVPQYAELRKVVEDLVGAE